MYGEFPPRVSMNYDDSRQPIYYSVALYLLTPWIRFLLENLAGSQLVKKFPAFYGIRLFMTALTSGRHLSLS
jgi:hypothetical protein